jgi:hypothetical protein
MIGSLLEFYMARFAPCQESDKPDATCPAAMALLISIPSNRVTHRLISIGSSRIVNLKEKDSTDFRKESNPA